MLVFTQSINTYRMIAPEQINYIEFNVTNRCNAGCPVCVRTQMLNDDIQSNQLQLTSITPELFETIAQGLGEHAKNICASFCGTTGDAMSHPQIGEIIDIAIKHYRDVFIETNGGTRSQEWWRELAKKNERTSVRFSIDGLADTNGLYRINTDFDKIIANAKAFIDAGGQATWKYIIFDHNQHQVEQAREMARDMGFRNFSTVVSNRFYKPKMDVRPDQYKAKVNKVDENIKQTGFEIKPATASNSSKMKQQRKTWRELDLEQDVSIDCRTRKEGYLFVDQWGKLWPCCFWASRDEGGWKSDPMHWSVWKNKFENTYGKDFNQLSESNTITDMLEHDLYKSWLPDSFDGKHDKCTVCLSHCTLNKTSKNIVEKQKL